MGYRYKAFISYSHVDERWASWLHRKLEQFKFPQTVLNETAGHTEGRHLLRPIFRDRDDLSAGNDLGAKIEAALRQSENLIVICSPASAKSPWVEKEILFFKQQHRDGKIFSVIIGGEPHAGGDQECFPQALRFQMAPTGVLSDRPAEPLAADLRDSKDGKRLGLLKLISGLVDIELDRLVQRDLKRNRQRVMAVTLTSAAILSIMGVLLGFALSARMEAEKRRDVAEEQIEFMLTDLKDDVESVGRIEILDSVVRRAEDYYQTFTPSLRNAKAFQRLSKANLSLGEIALEYGRLTEPKPLGRSAQDYFGDAYTQAQQLYDKDPNNAEYVFGLAQAAFWQGQLNFSQSTKETAFKYFTQYQALSDQLTQLKPNTLEARRERLNAQTNLVAWNLYFGSGPSAVQGIDQLLLDGEALSDDYPESVSFKRELAQIYAWAADAQPPEKVAYAVKLRRRQLEITTDIAVADPANLRLQSEKHYAVSGLAKALIRAENFGDAIDTIDQALPQSRSLWRINPASEIATGNLAILLLHKVDALWRAGRASEAEQALAAYDAHQNRSTAVVGYSANIFSTLASERSDLGRKISQTK